MRVTLFRLCVVLAAALLACPVAAQPEPSPPKDEGAFVNYVAGRLARVSGAKVEPAERLSLNLSAADGSHLLTANLDRVWSACQRVRERCATFVDEYVASISSMIEERSRPPEKEALRIIIRPKSYLETMKGQDPAKALLARPFVGDLAMTLVIDGARSIRSAQRQDLDRLKLSVDEAFEIAKQNLRTRELKPLDAVLKPITGRAIGYLEENAYESSRLLFHEDWKRYAGQIGTLIVAIPATNYLIYGSGANPEATEVLRAFALEVARKSQRPLSPLVFRWKPEGWEIVR
jgi:uncharacterized protein YtpQ (UPF0354 family)